MTRVFRKRIFSKRTAYCCLAFMAAVGYSRQAERVYIDQKLAGYYIALHDMHQDRRKPGEKCTALHRLSQAGQGFANGMMFVFMPLSAKFSGNSESTYAGAALYTLDLISTLPFNGLAHASGAMEGFDAYCTRGQGINIRPATPHLRRDPAAPKPYEFSI